MKNGKLKKVILILAMVILAMCLAIPVYAATGDTTAIKVAAENASGIKAIAMALVVGLAAAGGGIGMGIIGGKAAEGISRQPEVEDKIRTTFMLGLVFIETAIIYALLVVILILFVL